MLGFLSNRATAAHLAIAAIAPLVLCKYCPPGVMCAVAAWISLLVVVWSLMAPVKREDEHLSFARMRFAGDLAFDPFFWVAIVAVVYAAVVALNSGVAMKYDAELRTWSLSRPVAELLPGAVPGGGVAPLAAALLMFCVYAGVSHSLDSRQAVYFAVLASILVVADAAFAGAAGFWNGAGSAVTYGTWSLVAAAAMFSADITRRRSKELLSMVALAGCIVAMLFSGCPNVTAVFSAAIVLLSLVFAGFKCCELGVLGVIRALLMMLVAFAIAAAIFHWQSGDWGALVPAWKCDADPILNRYAIDAWKASPWTGTGAGSFPLVAKMAATAEDWMTLGPLPDYGRNAWRTLLVERGMVGLLVIAASLGAVLYTWGRYAVQRGFEHFAAAVPLLPIAIGAVSTIMVFDGSALQPEAIVAFVALAAFSVNGGQ